MLSRLTLPTSATALGICRIGVGAAAVVKALVFFPLAQRLTLSDVLVAPVFAWMPTPNRPLLITAMIVWLTAAVLFAVGWRVHVSGPVLVVVLVGMLFLDQQTYSNHLYLMATLVALLTLSDAGAGLAVRSAARPVPLWGCLLVMTQVSAVYFFAAVTKMNPVFLSGQVLDSAMVGGVVTAPAFLKAAATLTILAYATIAVELFLAIGLWVPKVRLLAVVAGVAFHATIFLLMSATWELVVFALVLWSTYPLFAADSFRNAGSGATPKRLLEPRQGPLEAGA